MKKGLPEHIAIIMDGNGRWAKERGFPRTYGHKAGADTLRKILKYCGERGIKYLTVYAFSTENWKRATEEVGALMFLFKSYLKNELKNLKKNNVRLIVSGRESGISKDLLEEIKKVENETSMNTGIVLNIAFNYGGRAEIIDAVNKVIKSGVNEIEESSFRKYLYNELPDPELLIRTSGEIRISNFLLWQIAYTEIYVTDVYWPDFSELELEKAIEVYQKRDRRFGGVK